MRAELMENIVIGKPDVELWQPSHVAGVREGNKPVRLRKAGLAVADARRSTGVNAEHENPIDPRMPRISPP